MKGEKELKIKARVVENLSDINLQIHENVRRYILWKKGKIDVRGPLFVTVKAEIE